MLQTRLAAAAGIVFPLVLLVWLDIRFNQSQPGLWLAPLAIIASQLACGEIVAMFQAKNLVVRSGIAHLATFVVVATSICPMFWTNYPANCPLGKPGWALLGAALAFCVVVIAEIRRYTGPGESMAAISNTFFVVSYTGILMTFVVLLRTLTPSNLGALAFVSTIVTVKMADAGAYFVGRAIGKTKLAPILSPGKTIEGAFGGMLFAFGGAALMFYWIGPSCFDQPVKTTPLLICFLFASSLTIAGLIGDLFESMLKRESGLKDSSSWLPGLGGMLDILDSLLAAAPVSFAWWISGAIN